MLLYMPNYRRQRSPGGCYFFTVALQDRQSTLLIDRIADLRRAFSSVRSVRPFVIEAMIVLPEHLHSLWSLPEGDADYSARWSCIKSHFSRSIDVGEPCSASRRSRRERGIWQRRFWEHVIRDEEDLRLHVDYIHFNAVKHGHVTDAGDWPYSTLRRWSV
ncbi:MAG TPA: transposase [Luteimonas sp.]|nr:transposase [Luteimonas sp.]